MRLNKIVIYNIFSFYEKETIYFDNLTLIIAQNGLGKTSILNAIKLCLGYSNIDINSIFNNNSKSKTCNISIYFDEFVINKSWDIDTQNETLKIKFDDEEYLTDIEASDFIKEKIPFFLVDLLFYDGEINSNILLLSNTKLKHLFEYIFDLDLLENMNKDSLKASKELLLNDENKDISKKYNLLRIDIYKNEDEINILKDSKVLIENSIRLIQKDIQKLDRQQRQENKKLDISKQELDICYLNLTEKISLFKKSILFEMPLLLNKKLKDKIDAINKPILEVKNQNELNKKIDIFSQALGLENNHIKDLFNTTFLNNSFDIKLFFSSNSFKELLIEIKNIKNTIDKLKQDIKNIEKNELANEKFQIIQKSLLSKNEKLINLQDELFIIDDNIINLIEVTKELEKELTKLYKTKQDNFATIKSYENLIAISNIAYEIYKKELELKLLQFNKALDKSTIEFRNIYSQIGKIYITNSLTFEIIDTNNKKLNIELLSAGQKQVLNFLTIKSILEFKKFSNFLMVDTPFGRLSNKNRNLIFNDCYSKFNQLSLLLTDSEFEFLKSKNLIFKQYEIFKNDLGSKIKEII
jgi:DNA repair exonuclease SbcCD ATPase subunit